MRLTSSEAYEGRSGFYEPISRVFADGTKDRFWYDEGGNLTTKRNRYVTGEAVQTHDFTYDKSNRMISKTTPEGVTTYSYDLTGAQESITLTDGNGAVLSSLTYTYDFAGRMTSECRADGLCTAYEYDTVGNRTAIVWPDAPAGAFPLTNDPPDRSSCHYRFAATADHLQRARRL